MKDKFDDEEQRLFRWAGSAPLPLLYEITVMCWPIILWFWWNEKRRPGGF